MTIFCLTQLELTNFRCFESLDLPLEKDLTVFFAENGGGKSALITALAMGLAVFQPGVPRDLKPDAGRDTRKITIDPGGRREPAGPCTLKWTASAGGQTPVEWSTTLNPASGRTAKDHRAVLDAMEKIRTPGDRWSLFACYGVNRLQRGAKRRQNQTSSRDRWDAYAGSLDPALSDAPLLQWLQNEVLGDVVRRRREEPERFFDKVVMEAAVRAIKTEGVTDAWYDPVEQGPVVRFALDHVASWSELSDGYHVFIALVADIARRAVMLNEIDGAQAPERVEGVVLIDEIDLHLHPRWQRVALPGLRNAFPRLQFIVTTHSPQVLSSVANRQVRRLVEGKLQEHVIFVEGRDSNAILRDHMMTDDRDEVGRQALRDLYDAIDSGDQEKAKRLHERLVALWGDTDPELIRAEGLMDWEE